MFDVVWAQGRVFHENPLLPVHLFRAQEIFQMHFDIVSSSIRINEASATGAIVIALSVAFISRLRRATGVVAFAFSLQAHVDAARACF